jgi:hypothetical protein
VLFGTGPSACVLDDLAELPLVPELLLLVPVLEPPEVVPLLSVAEPLARVAVGDAEW